MKPKPHPAFLRDGNRPERATLTYLVDKWTRCGRVSLSDSTIGACETLELFPPRNFCPPEIETSNAILFDRREFTEVEMVTAIVANHGPTPATDYGQPLVIKCIFCKVTFMPFNRDGKSKFSPMQ